MNPLRLALPVLALAAVAAAPPPLVKPLDPAAAFQGDRGRVVFDPACRDYDVVSVAANPACAARLAAGDTAISLAVAAQTAAGPQPQRREAVAILERAIARENHPAAHYLLGNLLGTGQALPPEPARAVQHLSFASEHGNPAAADLLASLIVAGRGTPRDMPRAVRLYEQAAATGWPEAATSLAVLYLQGRLLPRDEARGRALLAAAAAAGDERAAKLVPIAAADNKVNNVQLLPAATDAAIRTQSYGVFDNPEIPPNFGYDEALQALHALPYDDPAALAMLDRDWRILRTPYLYEFARRLAVGDPQRSVRVYFLAKTRMNYDAARCADNAATEASTAWDRLIANDFAPALVQLDRAQRAAAARAAVADEALLPGDTQPWWVCRSGLAAMSAALTGKPLPVAYKPASEWPALRDAARGPLVAVAAMVVSPK